MHTREFPPSSSAPLTPNEFQVDACPMCKDRGIERVGPISYEMPLVFGDSPIHLTSTPELWICRACRSGFTQNALPESVAGRLYSDKRSDRWAAVRPFDEDRPLSQVNELRKVLGGGLRVLDIGCSSGQFLDFAKLQGCRTAGIEYSESARRDCITRGHEVSANRKAFGEEPAFDVVTCFDVLEHVYDPPAFLEDYARLLRPGGRFVILTGDIGCRMALQFRSDWWYVRYPEHVRFPSHRFLSSMGSFSLETRLETFATTHHERGWLRKLWGRWKAQRRGTYGGSPSFLPDHQFLILKKS